ncbi:MAG: hypothetical protein ACRDRL_32340, partial [Sciscionella sp.]
SGGHSPGNSTVATPPVTTTSSPAANSRQPDASIHAGGPCAWNQVADHEVAADGTAVSCTYQQDGSYRWQRVR